VGKRKKISRVKSFLKLAGWLSVAASLICFGLGFQKCGAILIVTAILIAFVTTEINENPDDFWHTDDGEENAFQKGSDSVD
jgi:hypothetical protein